MEILEGRTLSRTLLERYSRSPKNWSFSIFPSQSNKDDHFFDAIVSSPDEVWQLKIDSIFNASPIVLGALADVDPSKVRGGPNPIPYGYRKLDLRVLADLLRGMEAEEEKSGSMLKTKYTVEQEQKFSAILNSMETVAPKSGESYAQGPFVFSPITMVVSEKQKELDRRLGSELHRLLKKKFPSYL